MRLFPEIIVILSTVLLPSSKGHAYLNGPVSRNALSSVANRYCSWSGTPIPCTGDSQSWNQEDVATGCGIIQAGGTPSVVGNGALAFASTGIKTGIYTAGQLVDMNVKVLAYHGGRFEFRLQDVGNQADPDGSLWASTPLLTVESFSPPCDDPTYCGVEPCIATKSCAQIPMNAYAGHNGDYSIQVKLPDNVQCTHCVLQWKLTTANSCGGSKVSCESSEKFWNCADIEITGSSSAVSPVPTASFTNAPITPGADTQSPTRAPTSTPVTPVATRSPTITPVPGMCEAASPIVSDFWCQHVSADGEYAFVKNSNIFDQLCACSGGGSSPSPTMEPSSPSPTMEPCSGPFPDHPRCEKKIQWNLMNRDSGWYVDQGMDGSRCSIQQFLHERADDCPTVTTTTTPVGMPTSPPVSGQTYIGMYDWTWNGRAMAPAGATMGVAFSGWANIHSALADSANMMSTLPGDKYISIGGGNANGHLYPSTLTALNAAITGGDLAGYQGVCYDVEVGDAGMSDAFAASFEVAKASGFKVLVTISHSAPYGFPDKIDLMNAFLQDANIDIISPQLYTSGNEAANDYVYDGVPWSSYATAKAKIVPSIVTASYYSDAAAYFSSVARSGTSFATSGFIQWQQS